MKKMTINWQQATTEFVVIVFGVLAALAVDEWRDERNNQVTEAEYLTRLRTDIEADIENFSRFEKILESKARFIQSLLDDTYGLEYSGDPDGLMRAVRTSSFIALPDSVSTTFDELQSTGRLALIKNIELRDALSKYYSGFEHITTIFDEPSGDYRQLLWGSIPGSVYRQWMESNSISSVEELNDGLEQLKAVPELSAAANNEITYATFMQFYLRQSREQAERLLSSL